MTNQIAKRVGIVLIAGGIALTWYNSVCPKQFFRMAPRVKRSRVSQIDLDGCDAVCDVADIEKTKAARVDADSSEIVTCPSSCDLAGIEECICSLKEDFRETWTILDDIDCCKEGFVVSCTRISSIEHINESDYSIITWLKTLYAYNRGWAGPDECTPCDCSYPCPQEP